MSASSTILLTDDGPVPGGARPRRHPVLAVPSGNHPEINCPDWCVVGYDQHFADLGEQEGLVIHWSADHDGVRHSRSAYVDNTVDPVEAPQIFVDGGACDGVSLDEAESLARRILAAVEEARS